MSFFPYVVAAWLFAIGLYGVISSRNFIHLIMCMSVIQSSTYVALLSIGYRLHAGAPIFDDVRVGTPATDPVVDALTLTDVVVGATVTALLLGLALQMHKRTGSLDPEDLRVRPMRD